MPEVVYVAPRTCESCYEVFDIMDSGSSTECGQYRCDDCPCSCCDCDSDCECWDCRNSRNNDGPVHDWNYRPDFDLKGSDSAVHLGLELEVGTDSWRIADAVNQVDNSEYHLYLKSDGSITGAEIVTHPMTLEWAKSWQSYRVTDANAFDAMLTALKTRGCTVDSIPDPYGCGGPMTFGLHVHVARDGFKRHRSDRKRSVHHQMTWLLFISRNARQLEKLARRVSHRWGGFAAPMPGELKRKATYVERDNRYVAVNCNNRATYELRFFAATLDPVELWAALEFADASVEYTRQIKSSDALRNEALRWRAFVTWVGASGKYPNLESQFITHSITN